jgi:hypothetical protein
MIFLKKTITIVISVLILLSLNNCKTEKLIGAISPSVVYKATNPALSHLTGIYDDMFTLTVTNATPGSVIIYTLDGSNPKTSSTAIIQIPPFNVAVNSTKTIKAFSRKGSYLDSDVITATYTLESEPDDRVDAPTIEIISSGTDNHTVRIFCTTSGATIKYTYNGEDPHTSTSTMTVGASGTSVTLAEGTVIKAYAIKTGMDESEMTVFTLPDV